MIRKEFNFDGSVVGFNNCVHALSFRLENLATPLLGQTRYLRGMGKKGKDKEPVEQPEEKKKGFFGKLLGLGILVGIGVAVKKFMDKDKGGTYEPPFN